MLMNSIKRILLHYLLLILTIPLLFINELAHAQSAGSLRVGATRVNITPPEDAGFQMAGYGGRTEGFTGILDSLYFRTIVVDDGQNQAAIVVGDLTLTTEILWDRMSERIEKEAGIDPEHLLLAVTHTHGAPDLFNAEEVNGRLETYTNEVADKVVQSVQQAQSSLEPARIGVGRGYANINVNRVAQTSDGGYWLGQNPDGVSDKTVHVVKFEDLRGRPIAILVNYGVHAVVGGSNNLLITADLPGATSRLVEQHYGNGVVVPWTSGANGDQNPIYSELDKPNSGRIQPLDALGRILGEEVVRVAENIDRMSGRASIRGGQKVVSVPGKKQNEYSPTADYRFVDTDSLDIRLTMLVIGHVAVGCISGQTMARVGKRFKAESPLTESLMINLCNGRSGYLPDNEAYERPGYEITVSHAKEGAGSAVVNGLIELIEEF